MRALPLIAALGLLGLCIVFRQPLEADPVTHVLLQLPLLAIAGALLAHALGAQRLRLSEPHAAAFTLIAVFAILFWMLPRYIDAALAEPLVEAAKFVSIPLLVGGALAVGWDRSHPFVRGFLKANAISMLGVLAFLYIHAPVRICNSYLVADQERLGFGFLFAAFGLAIVWSVPLFISPREQFQISELSAKSTAA